MAKKSGRSFLLVCVLFVFACLLVSGGSRLIGSDAQEEPMAARPLASIRAVLSGSALQRGETGLASLRRQSVQREQRAPAPENRSLYHMALCDANGNVLLGRTYMRAVYQAFALDDGFV